MDTTLFWLWLATLSALALFLQGVLVLRVAIHTRHLWWSLLACVPLAVSLWSWQQIWIASTMAQRPFIIWQHINAALYAKLLESSSHATRVAQGQIVILLIVFVLTGVVEARFLPPVKIPPVWTMRRLDRVNR